MNKKIVLIILSFLVFTFSVTIKAESKATPVYDDTKTSYWQEGTKEETNLYGMNHSLISAITNTGGANFQQQVNLFEMKTDGVNSKLVTWAKQSGNQTLTRATLTNIARDYEAKHPGWIVVGGINADQFYTKQGNKRGEDGSYPYIGQTYYPFIMDGERRFTVTPYGITTNFVGITNNPDNPFVYPSALKGYSLSILDDNNNVINKFIVDGINVEPGTNGTTVWSAYNQANTGSSVVQEISSSSNNIYYIETADIAYINVNPIYGLSGENQISFFGKGTISSVVNEAKVSGGQFAVETTNEELISSLSTGKKIIVQMDYVDENMNNVEAASGFHSIQRINGKDESSTASYNTRQYNRSIFGRKADGTYVLVTVDFKNGNNLYGGQNFTQTNAMLKAYGITEAYQDDGGGSVTAIVKNQSGFFDVTNFCSDGSPRSVLTGLFFVVRDPNIKIDNTKTTRSTVEIVQEDTEYNKVKDMKVVHNGQTYEAVDGRIKIDNLEENTEHIFTILYSIAGKESEQYYNTSTSLSVKTLPFIYPSSGLSLIGKTNSSMTFQKSAGAGSENIRNVVVHIGDNTYNMGDEYEFVAENLISGVEYEVYFEYDIYDPETGKMYHAEDEKFLSKTLSFEVPVISRFELYKNDETTAILKYTYKDSDDVVKGAYIYANDLSFSLDKATGTYETMGFDLTQEEVILKLVLEYEDDEGNTYKIESEEIKLDKIEETKKGCKKKKMVEIISLISTVSFAFYILRKRNK